MSAPFDSRPPGGFRIITADERLAEQRGIKGVLTGISGIGKTSQLWTLDASRTLFVNLEAGELAVQGWPGDEVRVRSWEMARDLACWIGGPNPAMRPDQPYDATHYQRVCAAFGTPEQLAKYDTIFVDSITVASRLCFQWCKGQPQAVSDRSGKPDLRGAYGLLGQEMIGWLTHLQHTPDKNVWLVGLLNRQLDDFNRPYFSLQIEGSKTGLELPGIVDEVITLAEIPREKEAPYRAFVCTTLNPFGYPAKDRSGRLATIEEPHLGRLMEKIRRPLASPPAAQFQITLPAAAPAAPTTSTTAQEG
ncbi:ATP-binding protein [Crenalkalicoccus roseus]|uniref:ATP-binding protein n=1 Tax=Crenalkalicoccus roseus TaxID=1485588 RepID=UPI00195C5308|nr:ATP-binding protein [Crenalkalicoccus roseus]